MIQVLVADDHEIVRAGLITLIGLESDMRVAGQARNGEEAVALYRSLMPDVVLMDLKMPGAGGCSAIATLRAEFPTAKILVLSSLISDEMIRRALQAGATGYLSKDTESDELTEAIRAVHMGRRRVSTDVGATLSEWVGCETLSTRELEVLRLVGKGQSNQQIGDALAISANSIKGYLKSIAVKLDTSDRTSAAVVALKRGLIDLDEI